MKTKIKYTFNSNFDSKELLVECEVDNGLYVIKHEDVVETIDIHKLLIVRKSTDYTLTFDLTNCKGSIVLNGNGYVLPFDIDSVSTKIDKVIQLDFSYVLNEKISVKLMMEVIND